jgi:uncharacterized protein YdhG (YjbR/CyaY superfamily)
MHKDMQRYIDSVQDERRNLMLKLQELILHHFPEAKMRISYQIPKYETKTGWMFLGYWKLGVSMYVGYLDELDNFKQKNPKIKTGKGSINLKLTDQIAWSDIVNIITKAMERNRG